MGLDIGSEAASIFKEVVLNSKTILWNGPMGVFEMDAFANGTIQIAKAVAKSKAVTVVGGGDSAMEEATFLTRFADVVYIIHRSDQFRASPAMLSRAQADPKIKFITHASVTGILGDTVVTGVTLQNTDGSSSTLEIDGLFVAIGSDPRTGLIASQVELTDEGNIAVEGRSSRTTLPGVFAAGDIIDPTYRQAIIAAGSGSVAALDAQHYLEALKD
jgi:thioredoxin reductase (NADPH)